MRSRYSAFAVGDTDYLLSTWHPRTRPRTLEQGGEQQWVRLDIVRTIKGGPLDVDGVVEFVAHYREHGERHRQHETSRFVKVDRRWFYLDALA